VQADWTNAGDQGSFASTSLFLDYPPARLRDDGVPTSAQFGARR
jgi:hypothetical protein